MDRTPDELIKKIHFWNNPVELIILSAAVFFGWILVVPFEGQIIRELMEQEGVSSQSLTMLAMGIHILGLLTSSLMAKEIRKAWQILLVAVSVCLVSSLLIITTNIRLWYPAVMIMAYFSGIFVAAWGIFLKNMIVSAKRYTAVVDVLIIANILMIVINVVTINLQVNLGMILAMALLLTALAALWRLRRLWPAQSIMAVTKPEAALPVSIHSLIRPFAWLCLFIVIITLNSGLMYQVVMPAFYHLPLLTSFYWAVPYIAALILLRNLPHKVNRSNTLYLALAMMGLGYLFFMLLPENAASFVLINTLMLGAMGVFDLFWWSLMISFIDYSDRPAAILGVGLAANVLGIFVGSIVGSAIQQTTGGTGSISLAAFAVIFIGLALLPLVNKELSRLFHRHVFLVNMLAPKNPDVEKPEPGHEPDPLGSLRKTHQLTDREIEIIGYIIRGYTYRAIAEVLGITEHTTKFHAKNIYQKLEVKNKMGLIKIITPLTAPPNRI
jgi:DNA-binding CsgD family transcriptional regulator